MLVCLLYDFCHFKLFWLGVCSKCDVSETVHCAQVLKLKEPAWASSLCDQHCDLLTFCGYKSGNCRYHPPIGDDPSSWYMFVFWQNQKLISSTRYLGEPYNRGNSWLMYFPRSRFGIQLLGDFQTFRMFHPICPWFQLPSFFYFGGWPNHHPV